MTAAIMGAEAPAEGGEKKPFVKHEGRPGDNMALF